MQISISAVCFLFQEVNFPLKERGVEKRDRQIVLHLQYVSELVAMQQDWESVEVGGW